MAQSEDSPVAMKLKKICLKTPVGEEQAAQAVLDTALGMFNILFVPIDCYTTGSLLIQFIMH